MTTASRGFLFKEGERMFAQIDNTHIQKILTVLLLTCVLLGLGTSRVQAQEAADELGNWLIYNGTLRFSDRWSMFTEAQLRLYEVASNPDEAFVRAAGHYSLSDNSLVGMGYLHSASWAFTEVDGGGTESTENRIYQQFTTTQPMLGSFFEHRYRLEERWKRQSSTGETDFSLRLRYRLQITIPLNRKQMERGTWFLNFYDELMVKVDVPRSFDQNRLYGAGGYQFSALSNLQLGFLWQAKESDDFFRMQIFYTKNFDFRD